MVSVDWPEFGLRLSKLAFGCASVMGRVGRTASLNAMALAYDHGVTHFDVARSYGFGEAESVLGTFIRNKRQSVTIATKFGIRPATVSRPAQLAKPIVRVLCDAVPALRWLVRRSSSAMLHSGFYSIADARLSLERSLRELRIDAVDLLLVHECEQVEMLDDDLIQFLNQLVQCGKVKAWGLAGTRAAAARLQARVSPQRIIVQHEYAAGESSLAGCIVHSLFSQAARLCDGRGRLLSPALIRWAGAAGFESSRASQWLPKLIFQMATATSGNAVVLCSMFQPAHISTNVLHVNAPELPLNMLLSFASALRSVDSCAGFSDT